MKSSRRSAPKPPANGRIVVWLAGLMLGIGAAMILVYRFLLVSHTGVTSVAEVATKAENAPLHASANASDDMLKAQAQLLQSQGQQADSGTQPSPQK